MKVLNAVAFATLISSIICSAAGARGVIVDNWLTVGLPGASAPVVVDPAHLPIGPAFAGITALSFSPGTTGGYSVATLGIDTEYAFGGNVSVPNEQIIIDPLFSSTGKTNQFNVEFGYSDSFGGVGETASLTVNGVTYSAKDPGALNDTTGVLEFVGGVLQNAVAYVGTKDTPGPWTASTGSGGPSGPTSAPEIDPASAMSAMTLLFGGLAIVMSNRRRSSRPLRDVR